jgi:hypothetical protein
VAVFLALGLGILIGSGMGDDMLVKQQRLIIDQMSSDFRTLREERLQMEARLQSMARDIYLWEKYQDALYPMLVGGALEGKKTAVISHGAAVPDGLARVLQDAGVITTSTLAIDSRQNWEAPAVVLGEAVASLVGGGQPDARAKAVLEDLLQAEKIQLQDRRAGAPDAVILLVGEKKSVNDELVRTMCRLLLEAGLPVVGLESSDIRDSCLGTLRALGISTIDNIDTIFGQVTLLSVLNGTNGHFGIKQGTEQFVAPFLR